MEPEEIIDGKIILTTATVMCADDQDGTIKSSAHCRSHRKSRKFQQGNDDSEIEELDEEGSVPDSPGAFFVSGRRTGSKRKSRELLSPKQEEYHEEELQQQQQQPLPQVAESKRMMTTIQGDLVEESI